MPKTGKRSSVEALQAAARRLGKDLGCRLIVLFGSATRGATSVAEDVDVGVLGAVPIDAVELTNRLIRDLGMQQVDVADLGRAGPLLLALVARDGIPLYEAEPGDFARFASLALRRYYDTRKFREMERREIQDRIAAGAARR